MIEGIFTEPEYNYLFKLYNSPTKGLRLKHMHIRHKAVAVVALGPYSFEMSDCVFDQTGHDYFFMFYADYACLEGHRTDLVFERNTFRRRSESNEGYLRYMEVTGFVNLTMSENTFEDFS